MSVGLPNWHRVRRSNIPLRIHDHVYGETPIQEWCSLEFAAYKCRVPLVAVRNAAGAGLVRSHSVRGVVAVELGEVRRHFNR